MELSQNKIFVLGLGLPKCGTTWFYKYLKLSKNFTLIPVKEYHIWDYRENPRFRRQINKAVFHRGRGRQFSKTFFKSEINKYRMRYFPSYYFDYFGQLLKEPFEVTADITPRYWKLESQTFREIDIGFQRLGVEVKPILILRDPTERFLSAVKMRIRREIKWYNRKLDVGNFDALVKEEMSRDGSLFTGTNEPLNFTVNQPSKILEHCINFYGKRLKIVFYEEMFTKSMIKELSDHFNVEYNPHFLQKRVNASKNYSEVSQETSNLIRQRFANTYAYFYERYPITKTLWSANQ